MSSEEANLELVIKSLNEGADAAGHWSNREPRKGSGLWLMTPGTASVEQLMALPSKLGLTWDWNGDPENKEVNTYFLTGPDAGEMEPLTTVELSNELANGNSVSVRLSGFAAPLNVALHPGRGAVIEVEFLSSDEFLRLHARVVEFVAPDVSSTPETPMMVGWNTADKEGLVNPFVLLDEASPSSEYLRFDYLLLSESLLLKLGLDAGNHATRYIGPYVALTYGQPGVA